MIMAITAHSTVDPGRIPQVTRVHVSGCILCHCFYTCEVLHVVYDTYMCVYLNHQPISAVYSTSCPFNLHFYFGSVQMVVVICSKDVFEY